MASKRIHQLLTDFDRIFSQLLNDETATLKINKYSNDLRLLESWRSEIESQKQSVFVVGKTSTGKSQFHNFILDVDETENQVLFKTSTKVETGVLQTLQHCDGKEKAFAEIIIQNREEFVKLNIPHGLGIKNEGNKLILPLNFSRNIEFLRDKIMAKSERSDFKVNVAVQIINIYYPLKYFRNFIFIDTPGLGSHDPSTNNSVRDHLRGKSHILWFLDASERTLSGSFSVLLNTANDGDRENENLKNRELLLANFNRITFIANKFDMCVAEEVSFHKLKIELDNTFNSKLANVFEKDSFKANLVYTSFKNPKLDLGGSTTVEEIKKLDDSFQSVRKVRNLDNLEALIFALRMVLAQLKEDLVKDREAVAGDRKDFNGKIREFQKEADTLGYTIILVQELLTRSVRELNELKEKQSKINAREAYNNQLYSIIQAIEKIERCFSDLLRAKLHNRISTGLKSELQEFKKHKDFTLEGGENWFQRIIPFSNIEVRRKNQILYSFLSEKSTAIEVLAGHIIEEIESSTETKSALVLHLRVEIDNLNSLDRNIESKLWKIDNMIASNDEIINLLIYDIESKLADWLPETDQSSELILENFLQLYTLLDEHTILQKRNLYKENI